MAEAKNPQMALAEIKPRIADLVDELVAKGADKLIYVIEKEADALRDRPQLGERDVPPARPTNKWQIEDV